MVVFCVQIARQFTVIGRSESLPKVQNVLRDCDSSCSEVPNEHRYPPPPGVPGLACSRGGSASCRPALCRPPSAGTNPALCVHGQARHPADLPFADLRRLARTRPSVFTGRLGILPTCPLPTSVGWHEPGPLCSRAGSASCRPALCRPPSAGTNPALCVHGQARHPADLPFADLRRLARTRPSGPGTGWYFDQVSPGSR